MATRKTDHKENWGELQARWGGPGIGRIILGNGLGGGVVCIPDVLLKYERVLGISPLETWYLIRLIRHYWTAGQPAFPAIAEMARQANISEKTLRRIRDGLVKKGLIKNQGRRGGLDNRVLVQLDPLFVALYLCILCDPTSNLVKTDNRVEISQALSKYFGGFPLSHHYENSQGGTDFPLPLSPEIAQRCGETRGITLDWVELAKMQGRKEMEALQKDAHLYERRRLIKEIFKKAGLPVRWNYGQAFNFLKWLSESTYSIAEIKRAVFEYTDWLFEAANNDGARQVPTRYNFNMMQSLVSSNLTKARVVITESVY